MRTHFFLKVGGVWRFATRLDAPIIAHGTANMGDYHQFYKAYQHVAYSTRFSEFYLSILTIILTWINHLVPYKKISRCFTILTFPAFGTYKWQVLFHQVRLHSPDILVSLGTVLNGKVQDHNFITCHLLYNILAFITGFEYLQCHFLFNVSDQILPVRRGCYH